MTPGVKQRTHVVARRPVAASAPARPNARPAPSFGPSAVRAGAPLTPGAVIDLQRRVGNRGVQHLLRPAGSGGVGAAPTLQRTPPKVVTPAWPPAPAPAGARAPTNETTDGEGNVIRQSSNGKWYLDGEPATKSFPSAGGHKPALLPINPNASYAALKKRCEQIRDELLATSEGLKGDMKYWFAKLYHFVTAFEIEAIESGTYVYPHMKMQEVIGFYATYKANLDIWIAGDKAKVEGNWRRAFEEVEDWNDGSYLRTRAWEIGNALLPSFEAHIRFDLPRAVAAAYETHYRGIPDAELKDFKSDFFAMGPVFEKAQEALGPEIAGEAWAIDPADWGPLRDTVFPFMFSIGLERDMAWEKAEHVTRYGPQGLYSSQHTRHPNLEPFEVEGDEVPREEFDWEKQPGDKPDAPGPAPVFEAPPARPAVPDKLFFKLDRPRSGQPLERAVRADQDLTPLLELARWTREARGAEIRLVGHASSEASEVYNKSLASARAALVEYFLFRAGADFGNNVAKASDVGEDGASPTRDWRFVEIEIGGTPTGRQLVNVPNTNLPSETRP